MALLCGTSCIKAHSTFALAVYFKCSCQLYRWPSYPHNFSCSPGVIMLYQIVFVVSTRCLKYHLYNLFH